MVTNASQPRFLNRKNIHFMEISGLEYLPRFNEFKEKYVHLSTHAVEFELSCFERYFAIHALMEKHDFSSIWHLDTDVFPTEQLRLYDQFDLVFSSPYLDNSVVSAHTSRFTLEGIREFTGFLVDEFYVDHLQALRHFYNTRLAAGLLGGVCDMQGLAFWLNTYRPGQWVNSFGIESNSLPRVNHTIANISDEIFLSGKRRMFFILNRKRYIKVFTHRSSRRYASLHFQGQYKFLIPTFIRFGFLVGSSKILLLQTIFLVKGSLIRKIFQLKRESYSCTRIPMIFWLFRKK